VVVTAARSTPSLAAGEEHSLYAGVFFISMAVLLLQISLTRIFSFTLWYHFAYVTISVALLGYGASGAMLAVFPNLAGPLPARRLSLYALACGLTIILATIIFATVPFHPFQLQSHMLRQTTFMLIYYGAVTTPFFLAGLCMSVALKTLSHRVSRLYFFDLIGAGMGCLSVVFLIWTLSTPGAVIASAVIVCLAGVLFARAAGRGATLIPLLGTVAVGVLGIGSLSVFQVKPSPEKYLAFFLANPDNVVHYSQRWTPIFRTDVYGLKDEDATRVYSYAGWGISPAWKDKAATLAPRVRFLSHDGDACAVIYHFDGDLAKLEMFDHNILKAPYLLLEHPTVLVIGVGGGTDIVNAIKNGARHVTGVELDPVTVDVVKYDHADFAGRIYDRPDVTIIAGEGRSTVRHSGAQYDLIQMTGVDTLAALSTGAYVLSESYLYTTEAVNEFVDHLTTDGLLSIFTADFDPSAGFPRHSMRQLSLLTEALHQRGVDDPANRIAVLASAEPVPEVALLVKPRPYTADEAGCLQEFADRMGFRMWALPGAPLTTPHSEFLRQSRDGRLAYIAQHPLNLTPTSDDNPFFFNYYQWRHLLQSLGERDTGHTLATGQIILAVILLVSIGLSTALILVPLFVFQRRGLRTQGRWGFIAFFSAIGLGFIFIEISFIQKFVLFLGYPTYSLSVVLFSLLTYSGIGSFLTGGMTTPARTRVPLLFGALAVVSLLYIVLLPPLFNAFLGSPLSVRVVMASLVLLPLGLVMGMFFPSGIEVVRSSNVDFVPWAWGINGCASVVGTVLAVMLAMAHGFRFVTLLALAVYCAGALGLRLSARRLPT
jgi:hypothetical protein